MSSVSEIAFTESSKWALHLVTDLSIALQRFFNFNKPLLGFVEKHTKEIPDQQI